MGQKIVIKKKRYWRKKASSKALEPVEKTGLIERIKRFFIGR
jgi:hypothetical protein